VILHLETEVLAGRDSTSCLGLKLSLEDWLAFDERSCPASQLSGDSMRGEEDLSPFLMHA